MNIWHFLKKTQETFGSDAERRSVWQVFEQQDGLLQDCLLFETCQRRIYISIDAFSRIELAQRAKIFSGATYFGGQDAYLKLLSILCGLESKIIAETEVFGQFKIFAAGLAANDRFKRISQDLILDVRSLRKSCFGGIGLRSYGSLSGFYVKDLSSIALIGGGQLAQKILPYLKEGNHQISIYLRQPAKAALIPQRMIKNIQIYPLSDTAPVSSPEGVIIAAPVSSKNIENWLELFPSKPKIIVDLRDQTSDRRLNLTGTLITLDDLFADMQKTSKLLLDKVEKAKNQVQILTEQRFASAHFRPFGWEDICA